MDEPIKNEAAKPNPKLEPLSVLVGAWATTVTHPLVPSRYEVTVRDGQWKWWRNGPGFSQRAVGTIAKDGRTIVTRGEYSRNGDRWEPDLELTYTRL
jgi:hypothetical protein